MNIVPESHRDLVCEESTAITYLATIRPNGAPVISPVWFGVIDEQIAVVSSLSSLKARNMQARPQVSVVLQDSNDRYRYIQIRGQFVKSISVGARDFLDELSHRYVGKNYPDDSSEDCVILLIKPESVNTFAWNVE